MFGEGVSRMGEILDICTEIGVIKKSGSWFSYGEQKIGQGRDKVKVYLQENPTICDEVEKKIREELTKNDSLLTASDDDGEETKETESAKPAASKANADDDDDLAEFAPEDLE